MTSRFAKLERVSDCASKNPCCVSDDLFRCCHNQQSLLDDNIRSLASSTLVLSVFLQPMFWGYHDKF
jgi:hypothetical protein